MAEELKKNIKNWIECDNYLIENQEKIKQINEKNKAVKKKEKNYPCGLQLI